MYNKNIYAASKTNSNQMTLAEKARLSAEALDRLADAYLKTNGQIEIDQEVLQVLWSHVTAAI